MLLTTASGQCIRFAVADVRVFTGRTSIGVRGIALGEGRRGDLDVDPAPRRRHGARSAPPISSAPAPCAAADGERGGGRRRAGSRGGNAAPIELGEQRYVELSAAEQFVLTVSERGYGKRTSSYEYRITGRGGKGIVAMDIWERDGTLKPRSVAWWRRSRSRKTTRSCWSPTPAS